MIRIVVTGGTFDKEYNELTGALYFKDTHVPEMLRLGRSRVEVRSPRHNGAIFWPEGPRQVSPGQSAAASAAQRRPGDGRQEGRFALKGHDNGFGAGKFGWRRPGEA